MFLKFFHDFWSFSKLSFSVSDFLLLNSIVELEADSFCVRVKVSVT